MNSKQTTKLLHKSKNHVIKIAYPQVQLSIKKDKTNNLFIRTSNATYFHDFIKNCPSVIAEDICKNIIGLTIKEARKYYQNINIPEMKILHLLCKKVQ